MSKTFDQYIAEVKARAERDRKYCSGSNRPCSLCDTCDYNTIETLAAMVEKQREMLDRAKTIIDEIRTYAGYSRETSHDCNSIYGTASRAGSSLEQALAEFKGMVK